MYKYISIYLILLLTILCYGWYNSSMNYEERIKILGNERDIAIENYEIIQNTFIPYQDKYVGPEIKKSMKYKTMKWRG